MVYQKLEILDLVCEPETDKHVLVGVGYNSEGIATDLTAITFRLGFRGAIYQRLYVRDLEEATREGILKLMSFVYDHFPERIYFYDQDAYDRFRELAHEHQVTSWLKDRIFFFDKYAKKHKLNINLVDTSEVSSSFVLTMFYVMQKKLGDSSVRQTKY